MKEECVMALVGRMLKEPVASVRVQAAGVMVMHRRAGNIWEGSMWPENPLVLDPHAWVRSAVDEIR